MAALCKAPTKSVGIGLSIMTVCKNAGKKTLGQDDFFVVHTGQLFCRVTKNYNIIPQKRDSIHIQVIHILN